MRVLFAVSNDKMSEAIVNQYQKEYKEIITYKNVYYFNAILKELQRDKTYDRVVISEDLEQYVNSDYEQMDNFIFGRLDSISDEASNLRGEDIPIILICEERRQKGEDILVKLFGIGIYNAIIGNDRSINEVCRLINRPRSKKDAKIYYKIDSKDVSYEKDDENEVSELEIQNILAHYKRIGADEEKIVDSFDSIASQYNDKQLKVICQFLPLNIKAVLEEKSNKYIQINAVNSKISNNVRFSKKESRQNRKQVKKQENQPGTSEIMLGNGSSNMMKEPVVIPSAMSSNQTRKIVPNNNSMQIDIDEDELDEINNFETKDEENIINEPEVELEPIGEIKEEPQKLIQEEQQAEPIKRGRGRPKKIVTEPVEQAPKRKRGRPRKNETLESNANETINEDNVLTGFENTDKDEDTILPGFDNADVQDDDEDIDEILPGLNQSSYESSTTLPGFEPIQQNSNNYDNNNDDDINNSQDENEDKFNSYTPNYNNSNTYEEDNFNMSFNNQKQYEELNLENIMTPNQKLVSFVGTSKNGTSFLVNNVAEILSMNGIDTAILDLTQNRNAYYIYTKNEENLRVRANECFKNLRNGIAKGVEVHKDLTVYTSAFDIEEMEDVETIIKTLLKNHTMILMDCDFSTPERYFKYAQEIYVVQSMDILTIQPLTAFLRKLSDKGLFNESKARVILNKFIKTKELNEDLLVGGISIYNDAGMTVRKELFNRRTVKRITIPFELKTYLRYLDGLVICDISLKGYSKDLLQKLKQLATMVYEKNTSQGSGKYAPPSMKNNTFNQMRNNY